MTTTRDEMMVLLKEKYPKMFLKTTEEFNNAENGIWTTSENASAKDGWPLFNYYAEDIQEKRYIIGVHKEIYNFLDKHKWYAEWYDSETIMIWKN